MHRLAGWAWLPIAVPLVALFGPALVTNSSFAFRDAGHFYQPLFAWCAREWEAGRVPLWNPSESCGLPVLADATSSVFYPGKLLFALPLDFALLYKLYVVLHVVLAAGTAYFLARRWNRSRPAAALAAISYACGGSVVFQYSNVPFLVGAAWLPLAALFAERTIRQQSGRACAGLGIVLALIILGGDPEAAFHVLLIAALYVLLIGGKERFSPASLTRRMAMVALAAVFAGFLAAVQVLPSSEATRLSERAAYNRPRNAYEAAAVLARQTPAKEAPRESRWRAIAGGLVMTPEEGSHHERIYEFSVGPWRLIEYVWPNIGGRMFPTQRSWMAQIPAEGLVWTPTLYLGLIPIVLAISGLRWRSGGARRRWLAWMATIFTLGSFGYYGVGWLLRECGFFRPGDEAEGIAPAAFGVYWFFVTFLPSYVYFRYPAKLLPLVALAISQLAAGQFDLLAHWRLRASCSRALVVFGVTSAVAACGAWLAGEGLFRGLAGENSLLGPFDARGASRDVVSALAHAAIVAIVAGQMLPRGGSPGARQHVWQAGAVLLTAMELAVANQWLVATAPAEYWTTPAAVAAEIHANGSGTEGSTASPRVYRGNLATWRPRSFARSKSDDRLAEIVHWERQTLFPKHHWDQDIALVEAFGSLKSAAYESLLKVARQHGPQQADHTLLPQPTLLRLLGTEYLVLPERQHPVFAERLEADAETWPENTGLWRMGRTQPRAWIVHNVSVLPPLPRGASVAQLDERSYDVLFPGGRPRDFAREAVIETLERPADARASAGLPDIVERCAIVRDEPQYVQIEADLARPGLLVLSDAWHPGWKATMRTDIEERLEVYRTNRVLRGVWLPAGKIVVQFRFRPWSYYLGGAISLISWLVLAMVVVHARRIRWSNSSPA